MTMTVGWLYLLHYENHYEECLYPPIFEAYSVLSHYKRLSESCPRVNVKRYR